MKERNGLEVSAENVIVTAGGAHALYVAFQAVLDPGVAHVRSTIAPKDIDARLEFEAGQQRILVSSRRSSQKG